MGVFGYDHNTLSRTLFLVFAVICAIISIVHCYYVRKLKILSVYLLPLLSICMCFENCLLYLTDDIDDNSIIAQIGKVCVCLQLPIFAMVMFEVPARLHEARSVQFCCVPYDQEKDVSKLPGMLLFTIMRIFAILVFLCNLLLYFSSYCEKLYDNDAHILKSCDYVGRGGFFTLYKHDLNSLFWLSLILPSYVFLVSFYMYFTLHR